MEQLAGFWHESQVNEFNLVLWWSGPSSVPERKPRRAVATQRIGRHIGPMQRTRGMSKTLYSTAMMQTSLRSVVVVIARWGGAAAKKDQLLRTDVFST
jgi:hypothetical protein